MMDPSENIYRTLCQANNEAARHIVLVGDSKAAMEGFRTALSWLRRGGNTHRGNLFCGDSEGITSKAQCLFRLAFESNDNDVSPHNSFCYYNRVLMVHEEERDEFLLSMVILFNLAITSHQCGLNQQDDSFLNKALELYKMVLAVTLQVDKDFNTNQKDDDSVVRLILLATFSNMGHIYSHFVSPTEEKVCQQQLLAVLAGASLFLDAKEAHMFQINAFQRAEWAPAA